MVATRTGQHSQQQALSDMPGVDVKRKTGGGKQANERPQEERPLKRTKAGGRSVDTGEDPQQKLQKDTKQAGLKAEGGGSGSGKPHDSKTDGGGSGDGANPQDSKAEGGAAKDVHLDKSDHGNAKPAGAQRSGASGKGSETRAAKEEASQHPGKVVKINRA